MVPSVHIQNYKSIGDLEFEARRVNVFIGEPNSGKSNLLEALAFFSPGVGSAINDVLRCRGYADLFTDNDIEQPIGISAGDYSIEILFSKSSFLLKSNSLLEGSFPHHMPFNMLGGCIDKNPNSPFRLYKYKQPKHSSPSTNQQGFSKPRDGSSYGHLSSPYGDNLPDLLFSNKRLRESISAVFRPKGYRLELRPQQSEVLVSKEVNDVLYSYHLEAISETLQRIVFYKAALESNTDTILLLDEPETNTFPFYTKYLAERIALDTSNQFFLTTHNPYVLGSIIEKTPVNELAVYVTRMHNYRTELHLMTPDELSEAQELSMDLFLNLDRYFIEE